MSLYAFLHQHGTSAELVAISGSEGNKRCSPKRLFSHMPFIRILFFDEACRDVKAGSPEHSLCAWCGFTRCKSLPNKSLPRLIALARSRLADGCA